MATNRQEISKALQFALGYAKLGWRVLPIHQKKNTGCTCNKRDCENVAKHPIIRSWQDEATIDAAKITEWWQKWPWAGIGIATGAESGIVVIDIDLKGNGEASLATLQEKYGALPSTRCVRTGSGGRHLFFCYPDSASIRNKTALAGIENIDVRGDGGYVVAPPSGHYTGGVYRWLDSSDMADLPDAYIDLLSSKSSKVTQVNYSLQAPAADSWLKKALAELGNGSRNDRGFWLAKQLYDNGIDYGEAERIMREYASLVPQPGSKGQYTEKEAIRTLESAWGTVKREPARSLLPSGWSVVGNNGEEPRQGPLETQVDNAHLFIARYGDIAKYVGLWRRWIIYTGKRWQIDYENEVETMLIGLLEEVRAQARQLMASEDETAQARGEKLFKHATKSLKAPEILGALRCAQGFSTLRTEQMDADPYLLNVLNGTIDLRTGQLHPHDKIQYLTKLATVEYDPTAKCLRWDTFLTWATCGNQEIADYLQRAVGYSLSGLRTEQSFFLLFGHGGNGKNTFVDTISALMGDYATNTATATIMQPDRSTSGSAPTPDIARLHGARLVTASEGEDGQALNESFIKSATGDRVMTARFLHGDPFDFTPIFKLWYSTNHKPRLNDTGQSMRRRVKLIAFENSITDESQVDTKLPEKLMGELSGILNWAISGFLAFQKARRLLTPQTIISQVDQYLAENDVIANFLADRCVTHAVYSESLEVLYQEYKKWASDAGYRFPMTNRKLAQKLTERGFEQRRMKTGNKFFGVKIRTESDPDPDPENDEPKIYTRPQSLINTDLKQVTGEDGVANAISSDSAVLSGNMAESTPSSPNAYLAPVTESSQGMGVDFWSDQIYTPTADILHKSAHLICSNCGQECTPNYDPKINDWLCDICGAAILSNR